MSSDRSSWSDVAALLRAQRKMANLSLRRLAELTSVSDSYLSQVERGLHQPSPDVLKAMAGALGIPAAGLYEQLGWLDETTDRPAAGDDLGGVEEAIARDTRLSPAQRAALQTMYRTLVDGNTS